jgi:peptidoglycan/LPS O-acetylase OafA/YrhL
MTNSPRFALVDALRGIASLAVVLFHSIEGRHVNDVMQSLPAWLATVLGHGDLGVAIFFVLSGFVIAHSLRTNNMTPSGIGRFMLKRSIRLDPPYWVAIAIAISFSILATKIVPGRPPDNFSVGQVIAHLFYVQGLLGFENINPVFWTLCLEIQFYFVFAVLLLFPRWCFVPAFLLSLLWPLGYGPPIPQGLFLTHWFGFLLGVISYWAWQEKQYRWLFALYATPIGVAALLKHDQFALVCVLTSTTLLLASIDGRMGLGDWRWLQFLGTISYSLYLVHNPITGATFRLGYTILGKTTATEALLWPISVMICIIAATGLWRLIERPSMSLARQMQTASLTRV